MQFVAFRAANPMASARSIDCFEKCIRPKRQRGLVPAGQQANYKTEASWDSLNHGANTMNYKTLVAASLMSIALTSAAFAQCTDCAMYPDRDYLNKGAPTPASKMMAEPGSAGTASFDNARAGARVAGRRHFHDANASIAGGPAPAVTPSRRVYIKNLHDSGYSPAGDFNAAGNMKVN
jgi:hypothetical protein